VNTSRQRLTEQRWANDFVNSLERRRRGVVREVNLILQALDKEGKEEIAIRSCFPHGTGAALCELVWTGVIRSGVRAADIVAQSW
jgi:hypothetical protein